MLAGVPPPPVVPGPGRAVLRCQPAEAKHLMHYLLFYDIVEGYVELM